MNKHKHTSVPWKVYANVRGLIGIFNGNDECVVPCRRVENMNIIRIAVYILLESLAFFSLAGFAWLLQHFLDVPILWLGLALITYVARRTHWWLYKFKTSVRAVTSGEDEHT